VGMTLGCHAVTTVTRLFFKPPHLCVVHSIGSCLQQDLVTLVSVRIGVLTGGGDCPGLNAVIRAVVRKGVQIYGDDFVGFRDGWRGPIEGETLPLDVSAVRGILPRGGTILGSSRTNPYNSEDGESRILQTVDRMGIDALVVIGGEDTLGVANKLAATGLPVVGVPKTIDNDLGATDYTFGFDTAVMIATEAIDRLHTTAESHHRVLIVEVMGRHAGWIAWHSGVAGGANVILIPERPFHIDEVCAFIEHRFASHYAPIVVVAEGALPVEGTLPPRLGDVDAFGHTRLSGIGTLLESEIAQRTGKEARATVLGHVQRGGSPTAFDRVLATRFGLHAVDALHDGHFGQMVALHGTAIDLVPISDAIAKLKLVPPELYAEAEVFFG
jgi:ATP-dependent phosphofructokinase / diphosphate-dependent phosphofructokinase